MIIKTTLTRRHKELLDLVGRSHSDKDGWSRCSIPLFLLLKDVPNELVERTTSPDGGLARLTTAGKAIVKYS